MAHRTHHAEPARRARIHRREAKRYQTGPTS